MPVHKSKVSLQGVGADGHLGLIRFSRAPSKNEIVGCIRPPGISDVSDIPALVGEAFAITGGRPKFKNGYGVTRGSNFRQTLGTNFPIGSVGRIGVKSEGRRP